MNDGKKIRVLAVEDTGLARLMLTQNLKEITNVEIVEIVSSGMDGFMIATGRHVEIDIMFLDLGLEDIDGIKVAEMIRQYEVKEELKPIFICALTGSDTSKYRQACMDAGMNAFLTKPANIDVLEDMLIKLGLLDASLAKWS